MDTSPAVCDTEVVPSGVQMSVGLLSIFYSLGKEDEELGIVSLDTKPVATKIRKKTEAGREARSTLRCVIYGQRWPRYISKGKVTMC